MFLRGAAVFLLLAAAIGWWATSSTGSVSALPDHTADTGNGELVFHAGGCASCHATPIDGKRARGEDKLKLGGGLELETEFGIFRVPNISPDPDAGIGNWTALQFVNAMQVGLSPDGKHYYPSFPYSAYARMRVEDLMDLQAYLGTLPAVATTVEDHELGFPWSVRRGVGLWKRLYLDASPVIDVPEDSAQLLRGRELVEGVGHCGECHTPRDGLGGLVNGRWLAGAKNPDGPGRIPNITPGAETAGGWSASELAYYFETGFTPDWDTVGGSMVAVQENLAELSDADRQAIAAYLKFIPAIADE